MKWICPECGWTFRRFRDGPDRCPNCKFWRCCEEHWEGMEFTPVFEFRKWLRRKIKVLRRALCL